MNSSKCWIRPSMLRYVAVLSGTTIFVSLAGGGLEDVRDLLPDVECVQERGQGPEVQRGRPDAQQVVSDPRQLRQDDPQVLAPRRHLDPEQLLDGQVPAHLVGERRDVI